MRGSNGSFANMERKEVFFVRRIIGCGEGKRTLLALNRGGLLQTEFEK